jgi:retinol dehydrogenase-12
MPSASIGAAMDLAGKNVIVTGANTGIGRVTALELARKKARVILACRSEERTAPVLQEIAGFGGRAEFLKVDLAELSSTRAAAESFLSRGEPLSVLVNNAGLAGARGLTKDGFEITFGTNHMGPYLFTRLLLPALERAGESRVVNVSSEGHYRAGGIDWDAVRKPTRTTTGLHEYCVSKLANVLFSNELARRSGKSGVRTYSLHPGAVASDVWREVPWGIRHVMKLFMLSNEDGARTTLFCATSDAVRDQTGKYYDNRREQRASDAALDEALAGALWERSAAWAGLAA